MFPRNKSVGNNKVHIQDCLIQQLFKVASPKNSIVAYIFIFSQSYLLDRIDKIYSFHIT